MFKTNATDLPRLLNCNGSRLFEISSENEYKNSVKEEGIAAHWLAEQCFDDKKPASHYIGVKSPNDIFITDEIADHVSDYIEIVNRNVNCDKSIEIDTSFGTDDFFVEGRSDCICWSHHDLIIYDFKYGWGIVEPEDNWTLISHAIGCCMNNNITPKYITFVVYQPRPFHPLGKLRVHRITYAQFCEFKILMFKILSNLSDDLFTGEWCRKCPATARCPSARSASMNAIDFSCNFSDDNIDNASLSVMLDDLKRADKVLKNQIDAYEEMAINLLKNGQIIENYSVMQGKGNTTWNKGLTPEIIEAMTGIDVRADKMITPKQAVNLKNMNKDVAENLQYRPNTGLKLQRVDANKKAKQLLEKGT